MQCPDRLLLQAYVDGELSAAEKQQLDAHLASCGACRAIVHGLEQVTLPLREALPIEIPENFLSRILTSIDGVAPEAALSCEAALEMASAAVDGELNDFEDARLQAHLLACGTCERATRHTYRVAAALRTVPEELAPADLLARIEEATRPARVWRFTWQRVTVAVGSAAAAAALLLALLTGGPVGQQMATQVAVAPTPAPVARAAVAPAAQTVPARPNPNLTKAQPKLLLARAATPRATRASAVSVPFGRASETLPASSVPARSFTHSPTPAAPSAPGATRLAMTSREGHSPVAVRVASGLQHELASVDTADRPAAGASSSEMTFTHAASAPAPIRVALVDDKAAPTEVASHTAATVERPRRTWVSRPVTADRELYASEGLSTKIASARHELDTDVEKIRHDRPREFVIR